MLDAHLEVADEAPKLEVAHLEVAPRPSALNAGMNESGMHAYAGRQACMRTQAGREAGRRMSEQS